MLPKALVTFIVVSLFFFHSSTPVSAADACPVNYPVCSPSQVLGQDCLVRISTHCTGNGVALGDYCCRGGAPASTSTPTPTITNTGDCVQNGNYCVPAAVECTDAGHIPGLGGVCPGSRICCYRPTTPTPTPGSSGTGSTFVPLPPRSPLVEGFDRFEYPCPQTADPTPDFNPLRPYPGSPCDPLIPKSWPEKPLISFACGKSLNVENQVSISQLRPAINDILPADPAPNHPYWCDSSRTQVCVVQRHEFNVTIDLSGATIPILGNTQDSMDDATRVNQYLMSYLSGTVQQAEQVPLDKNDPKAIDRLVNFVGPLKKLLSFDSQNKIKSTLVVGPIFSQYHNYIVGCRKDRDIGYFITLAITTIQNAISVRQNAQDAAYAALHLALVPWDGLIKVADTISSGSASNLPPAQIAINVFNEGVLRDNRAIDILVNLGGQFWSNLSSQMRALTTDAAESCKTSDDVKRLTDMRGHLPPDPSGFPDFTSYWTAYSVWHGGFGTVGTPIGAINLFGNTSVWASLFQNVPFTTLEDTVGEFTVSVMDSANQQPEGVITGNSNMPITLTISSADTRITVPHVRALDALSGLLQNIMAPKDHLANFNQTGAISSHQAVGDGPDPQHTLQVIGPGNSSVTAGNAAPFPLFTTHDSICDLKDIRINPGDYLYGQNVTARLSYYQRFSYSPPGSSAGACTPNGDDCTTGSECCSGQCNLRNQNEPIFGYYCASNDIQRTTEARVAVFSKTPLIDQIYDKLVAGRYSIFRRFLHAQECAPNCSDEEKKHYIRQDAETIPAAIGATYTGDGTVTAGDKTGGGQIYIPRLGSLFDYFLGAAKENFNLQKMLRPKGVGGTGEAGLVGLHNESMAQIAARLGVPVEYLDAIWLLETNRSPSGSYCNCGVNACGPMAIDQNNFNLILTPAERPLYNRCLLPDAFELAARVLLHKKYCLSSLCLYDAANPTSNGPVTLNDIEVVGRYMGTNNCEPHPQTQCRWGTGVSYCDAIQSILDTGSLPPPASPADRIRWC